MVCEDVVMNVTSHGRILSLTNAVYFDMPFQFIPYMNSISKSSYENEAARYFLTSDTQHGSTL